MISVLQKVEIAVSTREHPLRPVKISLEGIDEIDCFNIAKGKYFVTDPFDNIVRLEPDGYIELHRLIKAREEERRELDRHGREKTKIKLDIAALVLSLFSIIFSMCALGISTLNRHRPLVRSEQQIGVTGVVDSLPNQTMTLQDSNQDTKSGKTDADTGDTCTKIQKY